MIFPPKFCDKYLEISRSFSFNHEIFSCDWKVSIWENFMILMESLLLCNYGDLIFVHSVAWILISTTLYSLLIYLILNSDVKLIVMIMVMKYRISIIQCFVVWYDLYPTCPRVIACMGDSFYRTHPSAVIFNCSGHQSPITLCSYVMLTLFILRTEKKCLQQCTMERFIKSKVSSTPSFVFTNVLRAVTNIRREHCFIVSQGAHSQSKLQK